MPYNVGWTPFQRRAALYVVLVLSTRPEPVTPTDRRLIVEEIGEVTPEAGDFVCATWRSLRQAIALAVGRSVEAVRLQATIDLDPPAV